MHRLTYVCIASTYFFSVFSVHAAALNAGIVQGIWLSQREAFVGDTVTIYAAVQNQSTKSIGGSVTFFSKDAEIGKTTFTVFPNELKRVAVPFTVAYGMQNLTAKVLLDGDETALTIQTPVDSIFIDEDTDGDRIGNQKDEDDDNDGLSDTEENRLGTDPIKNDSDNDGIPDKEEVTEGTDPTKQDTDGDGLPDNQEKTLGTDPKNPDTDGDGTKDGEEVSRGSDPKSAKNAETQKSFSLPSLFSGSSPTQENSLEAGKADTSTGESTVTGVLKTGASITSAAANEVTQTVSPIASWGADALERGASSLASLEQTKESAITPISSKKPFSGIFSGIAHTIESVTSILSKSVEPWYTKTGSVSLLVISFFLRWWLWTLTLFLCIWVYRKIRRSSRDYNPDLHSLEDDLDELKRK